MSAPWNRFFLYPRTVQPLSRTFQVHSCEQTHKYEDEERSLHAYRNRIQVYEVQLPHGRNWEYYKKAVNPYEWVYTQKKYDCFPDSICFLKPLSRSYFKMIEILDRVQFFESRVTPIRSAHVCEGPGGFIEALYDESRKRQQACVSSIAMTLKSRQSHIPGWRKASAFLRKNPTVEIVYGADGTGDIIKPENQQCFIDRVTEGELEHHVDLFTADGGFDVSYDYEKQETLVFPLLIASTKIGLETLKKGGVFVLKVFDFYHTVTVDLLYFLSCHFQEWTLYKPSMSRPCNPEHYFIGKGFLGCTEETRDAMRLWCLMVENQEPVESLFNEDMVYDASFREWVAEQRTKSYTTQTESLMRVFQMIEQERAKDDIDEKATVLPTPVVAECLTMKDELLRNEYESYRWCKTFNVPMYAYRSLSIEASHNGLPVSCLP